MGLGRFVKIKVDSEAEFTKLFDAGTLEAAKSDKQKDSGMFRVSGIGYCLKSTYLTAKAGGKMNEIGFLRKVNFGTVIHELCQKYLAASGKLYGLYFCKECKAIVGPSYGGMCELCAAKKPLEYSEMVVINGKLRVSGHPDGFMNIGGKVKLIEIKSISQYYKIGDGPANVDKYVPEHKRQANFYMGVLMEESTIVKGVDRDEFRAVFDPTEYILAYWDKGADAMVPYAFPYSDEMYQKDRARVQLYHACVAAGKVPEGEHTVKGCRYCEHLNVCNGLA